jgi:hypothetical protein
MTPYKVRLYCVCLDVWHTFIRTSSENQLYFTFIAFNSVRYFSKNSLNHSLNVISVHFWEGEFMLYSGKYVRVNLN